MSPLRIALWQAPQMPLDVAGNLARIDRAAADAAGQGAELLVVPEMLLTGYDIGAAAAATLAEAADGPSAMRIAEMAVRHRIAIVYGYPERAGDDVFNSAQWMTAEGVRLVNYRKTHLYGELDRSTFTPGATDCAVVEWRGWQVAILICYDVEFPEPVRRLAVAGADLIVVPTANMIAYDFVPRTLVRARAFESQVAVAYVNCCGFEGGLQYGGLSVFAMADGGLPVVAGRDETLLVATLDRVRLDQSRSVNSHLRDRRVDL